MIRNCFHFNPAGTPVNMAGIELQRVFDEKWKNLPQPKPHAYDDDMDAEDDDNEDDNHHRALFVSLHFSHSLQTLLVSRHRRDGETDRGHARNHLCTEATEEEANEEGSSSTANACGFLVQ